MHFDIQRRYNSRIEFRLSDEARDHACAISREKSRLIIFNNMSEHVS